MFVYLKAIASPAEIDCELNIETKLLGSPHPRVNEKLYHMFGGKFATIASNFLGVSMMNFSSESIVRLMP